MLARRAEEEGGRGTVERLTVLQLLGYGEFTSAHDIELDLFELLAFDMRSL